MKIRKYEKLVISICMLLVVSFALVTATYAWYAGTDPTILDALNLTLDDKGDLKVEIVLESGERMDDVVNVKQPKPVEEDLAQTLQETETQETTQETTEPQNQSETQETSETQEQTATE